MAIIGSMMKVFSNEIFNVFNFLASIIG